VITMAGFAEPGVCDRKRYVLATERLPLTGQRDSRHTSEKVYLAPMAFTLWLSAEEEDLLARIMRQEGTHNKQQAVIAAIRAMGAKLAADRQGQGLIADVRGDGAARTLTDVR
jgi:hypothetical protein